MIATKGWDEGAIVNVHGSLVMSVRRSTGGYVAGSRRVRSERCDGGKCLFWRLFVVWRGRRGGKEYEGGTLAWGECARARQRAVVMVSCRGWVV